MPEANPDTSLPDYVLQRIEDIRSGRADYLYLGSLGLESVPESVLELSELKTLDLNHNQIHTIPPRLFDLPKLEHVTLIANPIDYLPSGRGYGLDESTYLRCHGHLDRASIRMLTIDLDLLTDEHVESWRHEWPLLTSLATLVLGKWSLDIHAQRPSLSAPARRFLQSAPELAGLEHLGLRGLDLRVLPEWIKELTLLTSLDVSGLNVVELPTWIGDLPLVALSAVDNGLAQLPGSLRRLERLERLDLAYSAFTAVPDVVFELARLQWLRLDNCRITEIPARLLRLSALRDLNVSGNPIETPPQEVVDNGLDAIRDYWRQRSETGVDYLCEAKLIILGEAGAGKTSLGQKIKDPGYRLRPTEKSTEGIDVIRYRFPSAIRVRQDGGETVLQRDFQVNIWDFGGQEIYHATHQFFLTRRSVYVLVCDDRKEDTDFSYWLQLVEMLSDGSPLLIVQNEKQDRTRDINVSGLRARFDNIRDALATNLDTNRGLDHVIAAIRKELEALPHVGAALPTTWKTVREALERDTRDYITLDALLDICERHGFTRREDTLQLSGYLHDLGICLHFQDDALLKNTIVLKPSWATDAVYRILDDEQVIAARGRFSHAELERIWSDQRYRGAHFELVRLMMKFQLCYALDQGGTYIAPQLLSSEQPSYRWNPEGELTLRYEYAFMPKGLLTRFIVATHHLIAERTLVWKTGVVLERDGTRAEVVEEYASRRIRVRVGGPNAAGLLAIVDDQLDRMLAAFPRLHYDRYLPCPCGECAASPDQRYAFSLDSLIKMARRGHQIQCHISGEMVDAIALVRAILPGALRRDEESKQVSPAPPVSALPALEVYVSYGWTRESNEIVDRIQQALEGHGIRLLRDREQVRYKDSIREFMQRIGRGKAVIVVISDKYLKSENCMFEMLQIASALRLRERVFPIVLADASIYRPKGRASYIQHWENEIRELDEALKPLRGDSLVKLQEDLNLYADIRRLFDGIADTLRDMNALTPEQHDGARFDELARRIKTELGCA